MYEYIQLLSEYYNRSDFRDFQNSLAVDMYENIGLSYSSSYNEVKIITELCKLLNGRKFEQLKIYSKKIHGSKSYVEFKNKDKPVITELADMVIISIITRKNEIVYEKTSFVQNKKEDGDNKWKIDQNQLYLLQNFPSFKGSKGIFRNDFPNSEISFKNYSRTLGTYGLFQKPGEMLLLNAETIFQDQISNRVAFDDLKKNKNIPHNTHFIGSIFPNRNTVEFIHGYLKYYKYGFPFIQLPYLGISKNCINIYEFIRNWTLFNIGELASIDGNKIDENLVKFNRLVLREFEELGNLNLNIQGEGPQNNFSVLVTRLNIE